METKKNSKADIANFSVIFFQIGLIVMLGSVYFMLEWKTYQRNGIENYQIDLPDDLQESIPITELNTTPPPPPPPPAVIPEFLEIIENEEEVEEDLIESTETNQEEKVIKIAAVADIVDAPEEEVIENVPFVLVANVPIYPGCENEKDNEARKKCMTAKIDALVKREFNNRIGEELGLFGLNRIYVMFRIDEKGNVVNIKSRGPHKKLEEEAERVVKMLPKMAPGRQRDKPVGVEYSLPILFEVRQQM